MAFRSMMAASALACITLPAAAADCPPLKVINTIALESVGNGAAMLVPVKLQGVPKKMLLDTGGYYSQLSENVVKELDLKQQDSEIKLISEAGKASEKKTRLSFFEFGRIRSNGVDFQVSPIDFGNQVAGIFAPNLFLGYDIDLDFAAGKMNYISTDHCDGHVVYWTAPAVAAIPIQNAFSKIQIKVTVDGKPLTADIDTGSSKTTMTMEIATRVFGLTPQSPGMAAQGAFGGDAKLNYYSYTFGALSFDGVTVRNPRVQIIPDIVARGADQRFEIGSNVKRLSDDVKLPPVIIGMDILKQLHVYIAAKEKVLYVSPGAAATPPASTAPPPPP